MQLGMAFPLSCFSSHSPKVCRPHTEHPLASKFSPTGFQSPVDRLVRTDILLSKFPDHLSRCCMKQLLIRYMRFVTQYLQHLGRARSYSDLAFIGMSTSRKPSPPECAVGVCICAFYFLDVKPRPNTVPRTDDDLECFEHFIRSSSRECPSTDVAKLYQQSRLPLKLSSICRKVHSCLTGPLARKQKFVDERLLLQIWEDLDGSWDEFEAMLQLAKGEGGDGVGRRSSEIGFTEEQCETYVSGWQVRFRGYSASCHP